MVSIFQLAITWHCNFNHLFTKGWILLWFLLSCYTLILSSMMSSWVFCFPSGTPGRTEGAGLAREGQNNAGALDWQVRGCLLWFPYRHRHSGKISTHAQLLIFHSHRHTHDNPTKVRSTTSIKAPQSRFAVYRQHFFHIPSGRAVIIHYSLANSSKIMSYAPL